MRLLETMARKMGCVEIEDLRRLTASKYMMLANYVNGCTMSVTLEDLNEAYAFFVPGAQDASKWELAKNRLAELLVRYAEESAHAPQRKVI